MTTTSNIVLLIMFVIGVILAAIGISMTFSDIIDDVANHSITPHLIPLIIGIVLIGVSASFGLKKREENSSKRLLDWRLDSKLNPKNS